MDRLLKNGPISLLAPTYKNEIQLQENLNDYKYQFFLIMFI